MLTWIVVIQALYFYNIILLVLLTVSTPESFKPKLGEANDGEMTIPIIIKPVSIENQDVRWVLVKKG